MISALHNGFTQRGLLLPLFEPAASAPFILLCFFNNSGLGFCVGMSLRLWSLSSKSLRYQDFRYQISGTQISGTQISGTEVSRTKNAQNPPNSSSLSCGSIASSPSSSSPSPLYVSTKLSLIGGMTPLPSFTAVESSASHIEEGPAAASRLSLPTQQPVACLCLPPVARTIPWSNQTVTYFRSGGEAWERR